MAASPSSISIHRFRMGVALFVAGWLCPLSIPLVAASGLNPEWKTAIYCLCCQVGRFGFAAGSPQQRLGNLGIGRAYHPRNELLGKAVMPSNINADEY